MARRRSRMGGSCRGPRKCLSLPTDTGRDIAWRFRASAYWARALPTVAPFGPTTSSVASFPKEGQSVHCWEMLPRRIAGPVPQLCGHAAREGDAFRRTIYNPDQGLVLRLLGH